MKYLQNPTAMLSAYSGAFSGSQVKHKPAVLLSFNSPVKANEPSADLNAKAAAISKALETFAKAISKSA